MSGKPKIDVCVRGYNYAEMEGLLISEAAKFFGTTHGVTLCNVHYGNDLTPNPTPYFASAIAEFDPSALSRDVSLAPWEVGLLVSGVPGLKDKIVDALRAQKKITAIKEARNGITAVRIGLKEAKDYVDDLQNNLPKLEDTAKIVSMGGREMILRPDPYSDNDILLHVFPRKDGDLFPHDFFMNFNRETLRLFFKEVLG